VGESVLRTRVYSSIFLGLHAPLECRGIRHRSGLLVLKPYPCGSSGNRRDAAHARGGCSIHSCRRFGCYGHNGADDAGADSALLAHALPGTPVRVQWMREQEHLDEPYGPAIVTHASAVLNEQGLIEDWRYELWSNSHGSRPGTGRIAPRAPARYSLHR
jgi:hypothetical protein